MFCSYSLSDFSLIVDVYVENVDQRFLMKNERYRYGDRSQMAHSASLSSKT